MTEKEKAKKGLLYNANDQQLVAERKKCKDLCYQHNLILPSQTKQRTRLMQRILGTEREDFFIEQPFRCDYGYNIEIGENFYCNHNCVMLDGAKIKFGNDVFIGPNCSIYTAGHPMDPEYRKQGLEYAYPITVGNDVWIGGNVIILPGVTIGDNCVIGAGSVVNKSIPSGAVAAGNPCKIISNI